MNGQDHDSARSRPPAAESPRRDVADFLAKAKALEPVGATKERARLVFALDATMSRQPTWDLACRLQAEMFAETERIGGLDVQLVYFRGLSECKASRWVRTAEHLADMMSRIDCRGGHTQIGRVLSHTLAETRTAPVKALIYVGDAMEEDADALCAKAGQLALLGVRAFVFQEGRDPQATTVFREIARVTGGAWCPFDFSAAHELAALLRAVAAYAAGGERALLALSASGNAGAARLLQGMGTP
jgi:hypothetical protein